MPQSSILGPLQLSPSYLLSPAHPHFPTRLPQAGSLVRKEPSQRLHLHHDHDVCPFQKAEGTNSFPEFIALYMRPEHAQKAQVAVVLLPNHRCTTRERLQGISHQYSISPRTIAKFICEKIHCNVLFKVPLPPKACGFSHSFEIYILCIFFKVLDVFEMT